MHLLISGLVGLLMMSAALLSVQNATAVTVKFLLWQSVPLPLGMLLVFASGLGLLFVALLKPTGRLSPASEINLDEFDVEDWE